MPGLLHGARQNVRWRRGHWPSFALPQAGVERPLEGDADRIRAGVGLAVEDRAVAVGLGRVAEAIAELRAVGRQGAVLPDLGRAAEEGRGEREERQEDPERPRSDICDELVPALSRARNSEGSRAPGATILAGGLRDAPKSAPRLRPAAGELRGWGFGAKDGRAIDTSGARH